MRHSPGRRKATVETSVQLGNVICYEDQVISREVLEVFPATLVAAHERALLDHRLAREIIATQLANDVVGHLGITFVVHLSEFVGGSVSEIVRAAYVAMESFGIRERYRAIEALSVTEDVKLAMLLELIRLGRRVTRWLLRHRRGMVAVRDPIDENVSTSDFEDDTADSLLADLKPTMYAKGTEYTLKTLPERQTLKDEGIKAVFVGDKKAHSSSKLIQKIRKRKFE